MVVNLYYDNPDLLPVQGFGYLIPRSVPLSQNPERALGVIFGSEAGAGQDTAQGTKLTVMLGGHWWDGWKEGDHPDEQTAIEMSRKLLKRHLNISETPTASGARLQRNAIPQTTVGHYERMLELDTALQQDYGERLRVGGAWYTGVGLTDCIRAGSLLGLRLRYPGSLKTSATGLGGFSEPPGYKTITSPLRATGTKKQFWSNIIQTARRFQVKPSDPANDKGRKG
jgi:protoporphyrinogen oxidase